MKKFRGTKYARIGVTSNPALTEKIDHVEQLVLNQQNRLNELELRIKALLK